jgi:G3E family GTPase
MNESAAALKGEKAAVIILVGFLGSGKTTLLKQILSWETDLSGTVVVVNEFGDVGVDGALLKDSGSDVVELTSGCICCTLTADLRQSLVRIYTEFKPERILIEASGVADPTSIATVLTEPGLRDGLVLKKIITVLDGDFWEAREAFGPLFYNQLEMADLILLNKVDLLGPDQVPKFLRGIHQEVPDSQVVPTIHCQVDPQTLWEDRMPRFVGLKPIDFYQTGRGRKSVDAARYVAFSFESTTPLEEVCFERFMGRLPFEMFRVKGPVRFPDRTVMVNFVGGKMETLPWEDTCDTQLAFIGWEINGDQILSQLKQCVVQSD